MDAIGDIAIGGWTEDASQTDPVTSESSTVGLLGGMMIGGDADTDAVVIPPTVEPATGSDMLGSTGMGWSMLGGDSGHGDTLALIGVVVDTASLVATLTVPSSPAPGSSDSDMMGSAGLGWGMLGGDYSGSGQVTPPSSAALSGAISDLTILTGDLTAQAGPRLQAALSDATTLTATLLPAQLLKIVDLTTLTGTLSKQTLVEIDGDVFASAMRTLSWSATVPTSQQVTGSSNVVPDVGHPIYYS